MRLAMIMDPIDRITPQKDTSLAMLLEAQARQYEIFYLEQTDLWLRDGVVWGRMHSITVYDDNARWFDLGEAVEQPLAELDIVLMRKDPPFDMNYIYSTYLLEQAEQQGVLVVNRPSSVRDANEKLFTAWFPQCCPRTLVTSKIDLLKGFLAEEEVIVVKPLDSMGGRSIFKVTQEDQNQNVILETMTRDGQQLVMAQRFVPEVSTGDKRIILINGKPVPQALARIPAQDDFRGNLVAGANSEGRDLTDRDRWICDQVGPVLRNKGLLFVGLDVIGDYLTEINVTSPTGVRELDKQYGINISAQLFNALE